MEGTTHEIDDQAVEGTTASKSWAGPLRVLDDSIFELHSTKPPECVVITGVRGAKKIG